MVKLFSINVCICKYCSMWIWKHFFIRTKFSYWKKYLLLRKILNNCKISSRQTDSTYKKFQIATRIVSWLILTFLSYCEIHHNALMRTLNLTIVIIFIISSFHSFRNFRCLFFYNESFDRGAHICSINIIY